MKQVVQNYNTGKLWLEDVPVPICRRGQVLVQNHFSVVSTGTERMKVSQARMSLLEKARARPDKVKQVLQTLAQVGPVETYNKVRERLDTLTPLGYSSAGIVVEVGEGIDSLAVGDRVACAGEGIACHAEFVAVPRNLCAKIPEGVAFEDAAFSTVGAIALNGVRQAEVAIGDTVLVIGLGLVGLLATQLLSAAGARVIGVDIDESKFDLARQCGAEATFGAGDADLQGTLMSLTGGRGIDVAYIAASTSRTDPMDLAGEVLRDRGTVVIVGMIPVVADWQTYYGKELNIVMARSYGPGRYDPLYENKGHDYPAGYVPWTERRNLEEFMRQIAVGRVSPAGLGPATYSFEQAPEAYQAVHDAPGKHAVGILFRYQTDGPSLSRVTPVTPVVTKKEAVNVALIGAGNFATGTIIPALRAADGAVFHTICSAGGLSAKSAANRHGFSIATSDFQAVLDDPAVDAVVIATRHDTHADFTARALQAGKHVFVEKPIALNETDLRQVMAAQAASGRILVPGFNRRFSPLATAMREFFTAGAGPLEVICRVNAGAIGQDSWYQDDEEGGWRIVSEGCHFVDLISYVIGGLPVSVYARMIGGQSDGGQNDNVIATLEYDNGSIATLAYLANGDASFDKERIEAFGQGKAAVIENWRRAVLSLDGKKKTVSPGASGKGHKAELKAFIDAAAGRTEPPISAESALATTLATFRIQEALLSGVAEPVQAGGTS